MSACKSSKANLVAIYHLEFYKKQNNWKFSSSRRLKRSSKNREHKNDLTDTTDVHNTRSTSLDNTYTVDTIHKDNSDLHNVAFVEMESAETNKLALEWQAPVNIWPNEPADAAQDTDGCAQTVQTASCACCGDGPKMSTMQRLQHLMEVAKQNGYCDDNINSEYKAAAQESAGASFDGTTNYEWTSDCVGGDECPALMEAQEMWSDMADACCGGGGGGGGPCAHCWAGGAAAADMLDMDEDTSGDSEAEFMRGAHVAPHSSELDLSLPAPELVAPLPRCLARLSARQLEQAAQRHARALALLQHERARRQKIRNMANLTADMSGYEEYPTRDVGLAPPQSRDPFVAGSHRSSGRLPPLAWDLLM
ncbi:uncharacterized protein LOC112043856 isoform X2 [Bicyclus anynana]|uniref:Uncharacterized protein LOC112043856 isoform X2 n=1 Tax=Bicyclus anynana TaxID=110368 RepID=A0ABM3LVE5_BICAN|nr:uncharacterized protein LOC112043856 isoform X2 [Bicyclus anynana]